MTDLAPFAVSVESELDREIEKLIPKIVRGVATVAERQRFQNLSQQRIRMLQGGSASRYSQKQGRIRAAG